MTLTVLVDGQPVPLRLERQDERWVSGDRTASVLEVEPGIYSVLLDGRSFEARIEKVDDGWAVTIAGRRYALEVADPRRLSSKSRRLHGEGTQRVTAPMPGKVVRVLVAEGDQVEAGQGLAVVEAMKMQNELKSPKPGRVITLAVQEGATVTAGQVLAVIE